MAEFTVNTTRVDPYKGFNFRVKWRDSTFRASRGSALYGEQRMSSWSGTAENRARFGNRPASPSMPRSCWSEG